MIAKWFAELWARAGVWLALAGAVIVAVLVAFLTGKHKGQDAGLADAAQQAIRDARAAQQATQDAAKTRADVEAKTAALPDAPAQKVGDADPATAAGKLKDSGWTRD